MIIASSLGKPFLQWARPHPRSFQFQLPPTDEKDQVSNVLNNTQQSVDEARTALPTQLQEQLSQKHADKWRIAYNDLGFAATWNHFNALLFVQRFVHHHLARGGSSSGELVQDLAELQLHTFLQRMELEREFAHILSSDSEAKHHQVQPNQSEAKSTS